MAAVGVQHEQGRPIHPQPCNLAVRRTTTRRINSPNQIASRTSVHRAPGRDCRRHQPAQSVQLTGHVPVHPGPLLRRRSRTPARHCAASTTPPFPNPLVHCIDVAAHRFSGLVTEPDTFPRETASHRRSNPTPCTQCTMPPRTAAHDAQWRPSRVHHRPNLAVSIKFGDALWKPLSPSFAPPPSPLNQTTSPSPIPEETAVGEQELRGRSSPAKGGGCCHPRSPSALSLWLASFLASPRPHPLLISCRGKQNRRCPSRRRPITGGDLVHFRPLHASSAATIVLSDLTSADSRPHLSQPTLVSIRAMKP
jgi:hypothetical protein